MRESLYKQVFSCCSVGVLRIFLDCSRLENLGTTHDVVGNSQEQLKTRLPRDLNYNCANIVVSGELVIDDRGCDEGELLIPSKKSSRFFCPGPPTFIISVNIRRLCDAHNNSQPSTRARLSQTPDVALASAAPQAGAGLPQDPSNGGGMGAASDNTSGPARTTPHNLNRMASLAAVVAASAHMRAQAAHVSGGWKCGPLQGSDCVNGMTQSGVPY